MRVDLKRREFLGGALATLSLAACGGVWPKNPNLVLGVVSDIHVRVRGWKGQPFDTTQFHAALQWFREQRVHGVVIAGDLADNGQEEPLRGIAEAWFDVFPRSSCVQKLFVTGNHDWWGQSSVEKISKLWTRVWGERYQSVWFKRVKGYPILGQHWENFQDCANAPFDKIVPVLNKHKVELSGRKPFFYIQHPHLKGTCYRTGGWGHDRGIVTHALQQFPNAISLSGHSHWSINRDDAFWRGSFTALATSSLRYRAQGLLIKVYDDKVVYERHDFNGNCPFGKLWENFLLPPKAKST